MNVLCWQNGICLYACRKLRSIHSQKSAVGRQLRRVCRLVGWGVSLCAFASVSLNFTYRCTMEEFALISVDCFCRSGSISRGFRGEFKNWHIIPGLCESAPVMENQFSVMLRSYLTVTCLLTSECFMRHTFNAFWSLSMYEDMSLWVLEHRLNIFWGLLINAAFYLNMCDYNISFGLR